jgi:hypothetical protein
LVDGEPAIAALRRTPQCRTRYAADPDRDRLLHGLRQEPQPRFEVIALSVEARCIVAPQHPHEVDVLVGRLAPMFVVGFDRVEGLFQPADTRADRDASTGEYIDRRDHLRRDHGIAIGDDEHADTDATARRECAEKRHRRECFVDRVVGAHGSAIRVGIRGLFVALTGVRLVVERMFGHRHRRKHEMIRDPDRVETDLFGARAQPPERVGVDRQRGVERLAATVRLEPQAVVHIGNVEPELQGELLTRRLRWDGVRVRPLRS